MQAIILAPVPTYAALLAAYPENGSALDALPEGTSIYVVDMQCYVRRADAGNYWIPERAPTAPRFSGSNAHWIGPAGISTISSSAAQSRKLFRAVYYRMPGFAPGTIARISLYQVTNGTVGAGTDACQLRLYAANPDGSPIVGAAPLFTWDWNSTGTGAGTLTLANAGANSTRIHADLPGGAVEVPAHFWLGFRHDLATTAPTLSTASTTGALADFAPAELSGTDLSNVLNINRSTCYNVDETGTAWSIGYAPVWGSWEYGVGGAAAVVPHLKVTA